MICFPNAKINLGLNIVSKREDGYHDLETVFYPIGIKDALEIVIKEDQKNDTFKEAGIEVDALPDTNLVMKALKLMRSKYTFPSLEVHLLKKIPFGAGIGGGSADASFMLKLLNQTFNLGISNEELVILAAQLGADCPFFIYNSPMLASGIGDVLEPVGLSLAGYTLVLVKPDIHVSTQEAFSGVIPQKPQISLQEIIKRPISEWKNLMINDFEKTVFSNHPEIRDIKEKLYNQGATYASMTGSGSSVFGIFNEEPKNMATLFPHSYVWVGLGI